MQRIELKIAEAAHLCHMEDSMVSFCHDKAGLSDDDFWQEFWTNFKPRENRFYLLDHKPDWDTLFIQMRLLRDTKNVRMFVPDYPFLIPRGASDKGAASWEYNLLQSRKLKAFAGEMSGASKSWVICPAQYDDKEDSLKYIKGVVNDVDLYVKMFEDDGDGEYGEYGAITVGFGAYRNYLTVPDEPALTPFKLFKRFNVSMFEPITF
jgi:hypothetical protein